MRGRPGTPEDIARMALALLSERFARYVTGTTVVVDGGLSLHNWICTTPRTDGTRRRRRQAQFHPNRTGSRRLS